MYVRETGGPEPVRPGVCGSEIAFAAQRTRSKAVEASTLKIRTCSSSNLIFAVHTIPQRSSTDSELSMRFSTERVRDNGSIESHQQTLASAEKGPAVAVASSGSSTRSEGGRSQLVPVKMKLISILLVTAIGFGSHWSSGVTGAMKSTLKKVREYDVAKPPNSADRSSNCTSTMLNTLFLKHPKTS